MLASVIARYLGVIKKYLLDGSRLANAAKGHILNMS